MRIESFLTISIFLLITATFSAAEARADTFDLRDFGAVGDGVTDDGPALQSALDTIAEAGGGTLFVPAGCYAIITPVFKDFSGLASSVTILGVESSATVDTKGGGFELSMGLDLSSEFYPKTDAQDAVRISGLQSFLIKDIAFVGTPDIYNDARNTLIFDDVLEATITHCEFYGLSTQVQGGSIVTAQKSKLKIEQSKILGCTGNSGINVPIIQNQQWRGIELTNTVFLDYGQRPELYGKMTVSPISWISIGSAEAVTSDSPRRDVIIRDLFLDEGGWIGILSQPGASSAKVDLFYITDLTMNVSNFGTFGHYLHGIRGLLVEKSRYQWSHSASAAIELHGVETGILDRLECVASANRIAASNETGTLYVIDSTYETLDSQALETKVITTANAEDDPVQFVRQQYQSVLGLDPDPAGHFYWSNLILNCGDDIQCSADAGAALDVYLGANPSPNFSIAGRVSDENGDPLADLTVSLSGSQSLATQTDADGRYSFANLPTSGVYTVSTSREHYTFIQPSVTFTTPSGDQTADFAGTLNRYTIAGQVVNADNEGMPGITVTLTGSMSATTTTDSDGRFVFDDLPALEAYTVTPSAEHHTFQPASWAFEELSGDQSAEIVGLLNTHTVQGRVARSDGSAIPGVNVNLSGSQAAATTTNSGGNYSFASLPAGGNYSLTLSKANYSFTPASLAVNDLDSDQSADFTGTLLNYSITGRITSGGIGLGSVTVGLSGSQTGTVTTDAGGNYSFTVTAEGNYVVTPSKTNYSFSPLTASFNNLGGNQSGDFVGTLNTHTISGRVTKTDGTGLSGATVALSGSQSASGTTNNNGDYSFPGLPAGGNYTVAVTKTHYTFQPSSQTFNDLGENQSSNFVGTLNTHTISGQVTKSDGSAISGVNVVLSGSQAATTATDSGGNYSFANVAAGSACTITLSKTQYSFNPPSWTANDLGADQAANFTGAPVNYQISGRVTISGTALVGVTLALSGSQSTATTNDADGAYSFTAPAEGNYTITPSKTNYTFNPFSITISNLSGNSVRDFSATLNAGVPVLISQTNSTRAIAFDSVLQTDEPFRLNYEYPWASDGRTRIMLFATNFSLSANETAAAVTVEGEDASHKIYPLVVEYVGKVPGFDWLNCITVRLDDNLGDIGDVLIRVTYRGTSSNRVRVGIGHIGGGPPDDPAAIPTPGQAP
ncbi:MAG TPA: carboxypeptidase regulatory-like domain-containing protein [Pyrinomonadaceae bacterium]